MVLLAGAAVAQDTTAPAQQPAQNPPAGQTNPPSSSKDTQANPPSSNTTPAQVKTQSYKGTLVDAACASQGATPPTATASTESNASAETKGAANRSASDQGCPVSANTTQFGLRMNDGHVMRFDMVGNERAQQAIKDKKKWNDAATAGKPIKVKVSGTMAGDTITVVSIS
jgi:hypothetical protein